MKPRTDEAEEYIKKIISYIQGDFKQYAIIKKLRDTHYHLINQYLMLQKAEVVIAREVLINVLTSFLSRRVYINDLAKWVYFLLHKSFSPIYECCDIDYDPDYEEEIVYALDNISYVMALLKNRPKNFAYEETEKMLENLKKNKPAVKKSVKLAKFRKYSLQHLLGRLAARKRYIIELEQKKGDDTYNIFIHFWRADISDKNRCPKVRYGLSIGKYNAQYACTPDILGKRLEFDSFEDLLDYLGKKGFVKKTNIIIEDRK